MKNRAFIVIVSLIFVLLACSFSYAQYWQSLPSYNFLWPLWSPQLYPTDLVVPTIIAPTPSITGATPAGTALIPCTAFTTFVPALTPIVIPPTLLTAMPTAPTGLMPIS